MQANAHRDINCWLGVEGKTTRMQALLEFESGQDGPPRVILLRGRQTKYHEKPIGSKIPEHAAMLLRLLLRQREKRLS
jgi:hypothetical protein